MAHGAPDWNRTSGIRTTYQLDDLGEAVARLGAINIFDRRGDTVFQDSFESGLNHWDPASSGTGGAVAISQAESRHGANSVLLTAGSTVAHSAEISRTNQPPVVGRVGFEYSFQLPDFADELDLDIDFRDGANVRRFRVRYDDASNILQQLNSSNILQTIATGVDFLALSPAWNTWKLVVDLDSLAYVRLIVNDAEISLSGGPGGGGIDALPARWITVARFTGNTGNNDTCHVDDAILTQNEP